MDDDPVNRMDPSGLRVVVIGNENDRKRLKGAIKKVERSNKELKRRIRALVGSKNTFFVRFSLPGERSMSIPDFPKDAENGVGTGSTVIIGPEQKVPSGQAVSLEDKIAHELTGHAFEQNYGMINNSVNKTTGNPAREDSAVSIENIYRKSAGEEKRTNWGP